MKGLDLGAFGGNAECLGADARLKKRIVRTVIQEVIADIDADTGLIVLLIHWMGGTHTELRLPRRRHGAAQQRPGRDVVFDSCAT